MRKISGNVSVLDYQPKRLSLKISSYHVDVFAAKGKFGGKMVDIDFLDSLRDTFPNVMVQAVYEKFVLSKEHMQKILLVSFSSLLTNNILSNKLETDILLRFAGTTQISEAIKTTGLQPGKGFFLILVGKKKELEKIGNYLEKNKILSYGMFRKDNRPFLQKHFQIHKKHFNSLSEEASLEDILVENAATLF